MAYDHRNGQNAGTSSGGGAGAVPAPPPGKRTLTEAAFGNAGTAPVVKRKVDPPAAEPQRRRSAPAC